MKKLLAAALLFTCASTQAEPVYELMDLLGSKDQMTQMSGQVVNMLTSSNPSLAPYKDVINEWADKYFTWESMRDDMAAIYNKYFTEEEIGKLIEFYETPVGQKTIEVMPQLFQEGSQIGMKLAQEHQPELIEMLEAAKAEEAPADGEAADSAE